MMDTELIAAQGTDLAVAIQLAIDNVEENGTGFYRTISGISEVHEPLNILCNF